MKEAEVNDVKEAESVSVKFFFFFKSDGPDVANIYWVA